MRKMTASALIAMMILTAMPLVAGHQPDALAARPESEVLAVEVGSIDVKDFTNRANRGEAITIHTSAGAVVMELGDAGTFPEDGFRELVVDEQGGVFRVGEPTLFAYSGKAVSLYGATTYVSVDTQTGYLSGIILMQNKTGHLSAVPEGPRSTLTVRWVDEVHEMVLGDAGAEAVATSVTPLKKMTAIVYVDTTTESDPSWNTRYTTGFNLGRDMWRNQAGIDFQLTSFSRVGGGWQGGCSYVLDKFAHWISGNLRSTTADVHQYATGFDMDGDAAGNCIGIAYCTVPFRSSSATSAVEATNVKDLDGYDPGQTDDFGLAIHHEISHNAADCSHPEDSRCESYFFGMCTSTKYNIMKQFVNFDDRSFWWTSTFENTLKSHSRPQLPDA